MPLGRLLMNQMISSRFFTLPLFLVICVVPCFNDDLVAQDFSEDPFIHHLNNQADQIGSFRLTFENGMTSERGRAPSTTSGIWMGKGDNFERSRAGTLDDNGDITWHQDVSRNHDSTLDFGPSDRFAVRLNPTSGDVSDYRMFPFLFGRLLKNAPIQSVERDNETIVVQWSNAHGKHVAAKWISATYSKHPPHDLVSVSMGLSPDEIKQKIRFSDYQVIDGVRFPMESLMEWFISDGRVRTVDTRIKTLQLNVDIPDADFIIDLPSGTTVTDYTKGGFKFIVDYPDPIGALDESPGKKRCQTP